MVSICFRSGNITNLITIVQTPNFIGKFGLNSSKGIFSLKRISRSKLNPAKFPLELWTSILDLVKLYNGNIAPVRNLYNSFNFWKRNLRLVINSMNNMFLLIFKRSDIKLIKCNWRESFFFSIFCKAPKLSQFYRILANL